MRYYPPVSPFRTGLSCRCPRCGQGALFQGFLSLHKSCRNCGLEYSTSDSGDGPAVFAIFIVGFLSVAVALIVRFSFDTNILVAFIASTLFALLLTAVILRPLKATLISLQFTQAAQEGVVTKASRDMTTSPAHSKSEQDSEQQS